MGLESNNLHDFLADIEWLVVSLARVVAKEIGVLGVASREESVEVQSCWAVPLEFNVLKANTFNVAARFENVRWHTPNTSCCIRRRTFHLPEDMVVPSGSGTCSVRHRPTEKVQWWQAKRASASGKLKKLWEKARMNQNDGKLGLL